jgi:hypothetical protein
MLATDTCHECNVHVCMRNHDMRCMHDMTCDIWWWHVIWHGMSGHDKSKRWMSIDLQKTFLLVSRFLKKNLHNLLTCVHFFSVDFFACKMDRVNMPFTKHRCILPRDLTSVGKHMLCTIYGKTHDKDQRATCSPWTRVNQHRHTSNSKGLKEGDPCFILHHQKDPILLNPLNFIFLL